MRSKIREEDVMKKGKGTSSDEHKSSWNENLTKALEKKFGQRDVRPVDNVKVDKSFGAPPIKPKP
jgi:hypothetical protein